MIDCKSIRKYLNQYLDNELTPEINQEVQDHLAQCPGCQAYFEAEAGLEKKLVEVIRQPFPDQDALWQRSLDSAINQPHHSILKRLVPIASAATVLIAVISFLLLLPPSFPDLAYAAAQEHQSFIDNRVKPDITTDSADTLLQHFKERCGVDLSRCACFIQKPDYLLTTGRLCRINKVTATCLTVNHEKVPISILILSEEDLEYFPQARDKLQECHVIYYTKVNGFNCAMVRIEQDVLCAIGAVDPEVLEELLTDPRSPTGCGCGCK